MDSVIELNMIIGASPDRLSRFVSLTYGVLVYIPIFDFIYIPFQCLHYKNEYNNLYIWGKRTLVKIIYP